jgi:hypothetical protein
VAGLASVLERSGESGALRAAQQARAVGATCRWRRPPPRWPIPGSRRGALPGGRLPGALERSSRSRARPARRGHLLASGLLNNAGCASCGWATAGAARDFEQAIAGAAREGAL